MARSIRVIVLNCEESCAPELRTKLLKHAGVKIVAEVDEPVMFSAALKQFPAEMVVVNLDADPEHLLALAADISTKQPHLALFGISQSNDPDLILQAMRSGFRDFLIWPIDDDRLETAIERFVQIAPAQASKGELICVLGPTGGCGASTLAVNLACELSVLAPNRTVIVDLDLAFGHVATMLDVSPQFTLADLCQTFESIDPSMVEKALVKHDCGVQVLARPQHFGQAEQISAANTANVLNVLSEMFDYVVCDGPSRYDSATPAVLDLADTTLMIATQMIPSVRNINRIVQELSLAGYNLDRMKLVINRYSHDSGLLDISDIEEGLSRKVAWTVPEDPKSLIAAINMGQPLMTASPKSKLRESIQTIAKHIQSPDLGEVKHSSNFFARMMGKVVHN